MKNVFNNLSKVAVAAAFTCGMVNTAAAMTYRFKFKVASSGVSMYACNAGVMSQNAQLVCVQETKTGKVTVTGDAAKKLAESCSTAKDNCNSRVTCTQQAGSTWINGMTANARAWSDHSAPIGASSVKQASASLNKWTTLVDESKAFETSISDLSFMFMTEVYNAKYFVDICIRAPQNGLYSQGLGNSFSLSQAANAIPLKYLKVAIPGDNDRTGVVVDTNSTNYLTNAEVKVEAYAVCDTSASGNITTSDVADATTNEASFVYGADMITPIGGLNNSPFYPFSTPTIINGTEIGLTNTSVANPRFCKVRYVFSETNYASAQAKLRDWKLTGAEMCTYTQFNDPVTDPNPIQKMLQ